MPEFEDRLMSIRQERRFVTPDDQEFRTREDAEEHLALIRLCKAIRDAIPYSDDVQAKAMVDLIWEQRTLVRDWLQYAERRERLVKE